MNDPSIFATPLTVEELCRNLLAIKPGEQFEIRRVRSDKPPYEQWEDSCEFSTPLEAVQYGYDVRPLQVKKFVLLYLRPASLGICETEDNHHALSFYGSEHLNRHIFIRSCFVEASSITAAAALAAPQPGETFLAAVPYPEAQ